MPLLATASLALNPLYLPPIIAVVVAMSLLPILAEVGRSRRHRPPDDGRYLHATAANPSTSEEGRQ